MKRWMKRHKNDKIWWLWDDDNDGTIVFSFDKKEGFYLYRDYPYKLTPEQKEIFDKENPFWKVFFEDRQG